MHDGPDVYMKDSKKKIPYESDLANSLLKSLQSPTSVASHQPVSSSYVRISSSGMSDLILFIFLFVFLALIIDKVEN